MRKTLVIAARDYRAAVRTKSFVISLLILPLMILGWTAIAVVYPPAVASIANAGPHGFTEVLYAYSSQAGNNSHGSVGAGSSMSSHQTAAGAGSQNGGSGKVAGGLLGATGLLGTSGLSL